MKKDNGQREKVYTTLDAYQAGFLTLKGYSPKFIEQNNKIVFVFEATIDLYKEITSYNSGAMVQALTLALAVKALKSQIHSMRMNNEKRNGQSTPSRLPQ